MRAQELISEALDRAPLEAATLSEAKEHCRECPECAAFVRAMLAVQRAEPPAIPADLIERTMSKVEAESVRAQSNVSRAVPGVSTQEPLPDDATAGSSRPARTWAELAGRALEPQHRRALVIWASAAAVIFVAAGVGAVAGVRTILIPQRSATYVYEGATESGVTDSSGRATQQDQLATAPSAEAGATEPAPSLITMDGTAYRLTGAASGVDATSLETLGTTRSALDSGGAARTREVLGTVPSASVYVDGEDGLLAFERITRTYGGRVYVLQSREINEFGEWPSLPAGINEPTSASGAPSFEQDGTDDFGTPVYRLRASSAEDGIAIAPNPPSPDPVAGTPSWTWWAPAD